MDKYYKKLLNRNKTTVARFIDNLLILLLVTLITFCFTLVRLRSFGASLIITWSIDIMCISFLWKMNRIQLNKFKKMLNKQIQDKLVLEEICFSTDLCVAIAGYKHVGGQLYEREDGGKVLLMRLYPQSLLEPKDLPELKGNYDEIIATCEFNDDCYLLCKRLGIVLHDKSFLLDHVSVKIDEELITREIEKEVIEIGEIKKRRKRTSFAREKWSKYLASAILLIAISGFMGKFRIIYIAFGGMCMSFCVLSLMVSKSQ